MTPMIELIDEDLCRPSLFPEGTLVIKTWGPGAARTTHLNIQRHLGAITGTPPSTLQVWRQEDPYRWYVVGPPALYGKTGQITDPLCFFRIEELGRETTRATIHWLPPTLKYEGLKKIVEKAVGGGTFEKVPHRIDQAAVYVPKKNKQKIPHYIHLRYEEESTFLLVTVPGRRTECRHCSGTDHWSNRCPNAPRSDGGKPRAMAVQRETSYAQKTKEKTKPTPTATTTKTTTKTASSGGEAEADVETEDEGTTWSVVAPRRKRKRQGPTPRTSPAYPAAEDSFYERALQSDNQNDSNDDNNEGDNNGDDNNAQQGNENRNGGNNDNNNTSDDEARNGGQDENNS